MPFGPAARTLAFAQRGRDPRRPPRGSPTRRAEASFCSPGSGAARSNTMGSAGALEARRGSRSGQRGVGRAAVVRAWRSSERSLARVSVAACRLQNTPSPQLPSASLNRTSVDCGSQRRSRRAVTVSARRSRSFLAPDRGGDCLGDQGSQRSARGIRSDSSNRRRPGWRLRRPRRAARRNKRRLLLSRTTGHVVRRDARHRGFWSGPPTSSSSSPSGAAGAATAV